MGPKNKWNLLATFYTDFFFKYSSSILSKERSYLQQQKSEVNTCVFGSENWLAQHFHSHFGSHQGYYILFLLSDQKLDVY